LTRVTAMRPGKCFLADTGTQVPRKIATNIETKTLVYEDIASKHPAATTKPGYNKTEVFV